MNTDRLKSILRSVAPDTPEFTVIFTGKKSKKVDGLYNIGAMEIIIHNHNDFNNSENGIIYTGIHELAHHIQCTETELPPSPRSHNSRFYTIFNNLLCKAEEMGFYSPPFKNSEFEELTARIKTHFLEKSGDLMREFGRTLIEAKNLCAKHGASFEDYINRILNLPRNSVPGYIKSYSMNVNTRLGHDNMKIVSSIEDELKRKEAEKELLSGNNVDAVKSKYKMKPPEKDPVKELENEKRRIERAIMRMQDNLLKIQSKLDEVKKSATIS
ncbi:MAG: hypothetical protein ACLFQK_07030 [Fibrobacterota bacterium]